MSKIYYIYAAFSISFRFITIFLSKCYHTMPSPVGIFFLPCPRCAPVGGTRWDIVMAQSNETLNQRRQTMRNISIITIMLLVLTMLVGCGEDSKAAAKEAAKSTGKLVGAVVTDAAKTTMEVATEVASGAGEVVKEKGGEALDTAAEKAKAVAVDAKDAIAKKAKETADSAKKSVNARVGEIKKANNDNMSKK